MQIEKLTFSETSQFSPLFLDYIEQKPSLSNFYGSFPTLDNFKQSLINRNYDNSFRETLVNTLERQYDGFERSETLNTNLKLLREENSFTITTGHQLNIFSGPVYFIYKIVTAINACKALRSRYPDQNFVPVYWMASEDHDFAEINYFNLFGSRYKWNSDQKGPVGQFELDGFSEVLNALPEKIEIFEKAYRGQKNLSAATRSFVNDLFGNEGLIILDADDHDLKAHFTSIIKDDLLNHHANDRVVHDSDKISHLGYKTQVFPRVINFFYMEKGIRERIILEDGIYKVNNTDIEFTKPEIMDLLDRHPEKFSPNVILRPIYQEVILPNLAYIGGPGEVAYWLQLKSVFDHYSMPFPILLPRNHALYINKGNYKKMKKLNLKAGDLFFDFKEIKSRYFKSIEGNEFGLGEQKMELKILFDQIIQKADKIDQSLQGYVASEAQKSLKTLENIEKRLKKTEESKSEVSISQIRGLVEKLFPNGSPQERTDNFLNFYINNSSFIQILLDNFDPFDLRFMVIIDE